MSAEAISESDLEHSLNSEEEEEAQVGEEGDGENDADDDDDDGEDGEDGDDGDDEDEEAGQEYAPSITPHVEPAGSELDLMPRAAFSHRPCSRRHGNRGGGRPLQPCPFLTFWELRPILQTSITVLIEVHITPFESK